MHAKAPVPRRTFLSRLGSLGVAALSAQAVAALWASRALAGRPGKAPGPGAAVSTIPLNRVTVETFLPLAGTFFQVSLPHGAFTAIKLIDAHEVRYRVLPGVAPPTRTPFSLLFQGLGQVRLPQQTYRIGHPLLGVFDLFIVPVGPPAQVTHYEAIFG